MTSPPARTPMTAIVFGPLRRVALHCDGRRRTFGDAPLSSLTAHAQLLVELNAACNALSMVPREIGRLHSLTVLKLNGNRLEDLPNELCECCALEELVLSEVRSPSSL